jgi:ribonuclease E
MAPTAVDSQPEPVAATPVQTSVATQEILKSDTVESFSVVESPAPADAAAGGTHTASEAREPATPVSAVPTPMIVPAIAVDPPKPAPAPRPAVGNTGSLFFTADADTPSSVTRHLFEPIPAVQPAVATEKDEAQDLPLLAGNDETDVQKKDSEHSA